MTTERIDINAKQNFAEMFVGLSKAYDKLGDDADQARLSKDGKTLYVKSKADKNIWNVFSQREQRYNNVAASVKKTLNYSFGGKTIQGQPLGDVAFAKAFSDQKYADGVKHFGSEELELLRQAVAEALLDADTHGDVHQEWQNRDLAHILKLENPTLKSGRVGNLRARQLSRWPEVCRERHLLRRALAEDIIAKDKDNWLTERDAFNAANKLMKDMDIGRFDANSRMILQKNGISDAVLNKISDSIRTEKLLGLNEKNFESNLNDASKHARRIGTTAHHVVHKSRLLLREIKDFRTNYAHLPDANRDQIRQRLRTQHQEITKLSKALENIDSSGAASLGKALKVHADDLLTIEDALAPKKCADDSIEQPMHSPLAMNKRSSLYDADPDDLAVPVKQIGKEIYSPNDYSGPGKFGLHEPQRARQSRLRVRINNANHFSGKASTRLASLTPPGPLLSRRHSNCWRCANRRSRMRLIMRSSKLTCCKRARVNATIRWTGPGSSAITPSLMLLTKRKKVAGMTCMIGMTISSRPS